MPNCQNAYSLGSRKSPWKPFRIRGGWKSVALVWLWRRRDNARAGQKDGKESTMRRILRRMGKQLDSGREVKGQNEANRGARRSRETGFPRRKNGATGLYWIAEARDERERRRSSLGHRREKLQEFLLELPAFRVEKEIPSFPEIR
ncbi:unnamed protein product [Heterotrigona itama]|uniref:Uncharacterized protein n=1 Tax=Heterotrigona itama TaxID=395501 RepID=A0A6V7HIM9_9HYME|nr:unnamed protein product [Heterotrigona itama]